MSEETRRGPKPLPAGKKRIMIRFSIKQEIIDKYGKDNLLRPEVIEENEK